MQARAHLDELLRHVVVVGAAEGYRKVRLPDETHAKPGGGEEHGLVEATLVEDLQPHLRGGVRVLLYRAVHAAIKAIAAGSEPHALVVGRLDVPAVCAAIENMPVRVYVALCLPPRLFSFRPDTRRRPVEDGVAVVYSECVDMV